MSRRRAWFKTRSSLHTQILIGKGRLRTREGKGRLTTTISWLTKGLSILYPNFAWDDYTVSNSSGRSTKKNCYRKVIGYTITCTLSLRCMHVAAHRLHNWWSKTWGGIRKIGTKLKCVTDFYQGPGYSNVTFTTNLDSYKKYTGIRPDTIQYCETMT